MRCIKCEQDKDVSEFSLKNKKTGNRSTTCKKCVCEYVAAIGRRNRQTLIRYLLEHPCADCGEQDIDVLEFDHIMPMGPGNRKVWGWINGSEKRMMEEVARCEVRCSNCHTRKTRESLGYKPRILELQDTA